MDKLRACSLVWNIGEEWGAFLAPFFPVSQTSERASNCAEWNARDLRDQLVVDFC